MNFNILFARTLPSSRKPLVIAVSGLIILLSSYGVPWLAEGYARANNISFLEAERMACLACAFVTVITLGLLAKFDICTTFLVSIGVFLIGGGACEGMPEMFVAFPVGCFLVIRFVSERLAVR